MVALGVDEISNGENLKEEDQRYEFWTFKHVQSTSILLFYNTYLKLYCLLYAYVNTDLAILFTTVSLAHRPVPGTKQVEKKNIYWISDWMKKLCFYEHSDL